MCLSVPGRILKISGKTAEIDFNGRIERASPELVDVKVGDYVLVFGKHIIEKISEKEALKILQEFGYAASKG